MAHVRWRQAGPDVERGSIVPHLSSFQFIPQAWSMSLELMFYALAPFIVRRNSLVLICIVILCQIGRQIAFNEGLTGSGFCYRFFPFEIGLFVTGILAHRAWRFLKEGELLSFPVSLALGAAALGAVLIHQYVYDFNLYQYRFLFFMAAALPFLFDLSQRIKVDRLCGELSYPIYLIHIECSTIVSVVWTLLPWQTTRSVENAAIILTTLMISVAYVRWIDLPFERWRQRRVLAAARAKTEAPQQEAPQQEAPQHEAPLPVFLAATLDILAKRPAFSPKRG